MTGFTLAAAVSVAVGLSVGVATTVGITLAVADHSLEPVPTLQRPALPAGSLSGGIRRPLHSTDSCLHW